MHLVELIQLNTSDRAIPEQQSLTVQSSTSATPCNGREPTHYLNVQCDILPAVQLSKTNLLLLHVPIWLNRFPFGYTGRIESTTAAGHMLDLPSQPLAKFNTGPLTRNNTALFLDLDGTLTEIVDHPDAIIIPPPVIHALTVLQRALDGALAIVSGRDLQDVERHLGNGITCIAGIHGLQRRDARGMRHDTMVDESAVAALAALISDAIAARPGLYMETKPASVALHYRRHPELEDFSRTLATTAAGKIKGAQIVHGKMVVEIKLNAIHKGDAVCAFMEEPPFQGRVPIYAGDDITDQDAFAAVRLKSGVSIAVGDDARGADYR
ncbi:MAG: trehalose-phosphatase, partial [Anderseniella sp.]|nr:trehalose-phosphatase [Anderseniella sp.]